MNVYDLYLADRMLTNHDAAWLHSFDAATPRAKS